MRSDRLLRGLIHERFVVTLAEGQTFNGLLAGIDDRVFRFVDAGEIGPGGRLTGIDGELFVERTRVLYLQKP